VEDMALFALRTYYKSRKKQNYMVNTGRSKLLDSFLFENPKWGALHKAWKGYVIAKNKDEYEKMEHYARIIQVFMLLEFIEKDKTVLIKNLLISPSFSILPY
jgi:hypothetical protein